jgi:hypothetical protein
VVARAAQHRERHQLADPLVFALLAVVGDVAGQQLDIGRRGEPGEVFDDAGGAGGAAVAGVDVDIAEVGDGHHGPTLKDRLFPIEIQRFGGGSFAGPNESAPPR